MAPMDPAAIAYVQTRCSAGTQRAAAMIAEAEAMAVMDALEAEAQRAAAMLAEAEAAAVVLQKRVEYIESDLCFMNIWYT